MTFYNCARSEAKKKNLDFFEASDLSSIPFPFPPDSSTRECVRACSLPLAAPPGGDETRRARSLARPPPGRETTHPHLLILPAHRPASRIGISRLVTCPPWRPAQTLAAAAGGRGAGTAAGSNIESNVTGHSLYLVDEDTAIKRVAFDKVPQAV